MFTRAVSLPSLTRVLALILLLASASISANAQSSSYTDGYTPPGAAPGAPAGSYALDGFDTVNPFNGGLNFSLPLLNVGGRGGAGYTMRLPIEQRWRAVQWRAQDPYTGSYWDWVYPDPDSWSGVRPGYGPGVLQARTGGNGAMLQCDYSTSHTMTLTRLTFTTPDGTEHELRDALTGGAPAPVQYCNPNGASRGTIFKSADGTAMTFVSDAVIRDEIGSTGIFYPSGYLLFADGSRYRVEDGKVAWLRDRNGNRLTFTYVYDFVTSITDSLGRQITIEYDVTGTPYGTWCDRISFKGFGGADRVLWVAKAWLSGTLAEGESVQTYGQLFPELYPNPSQSTVHDPSVVSGVWLPDGRAYKFRYNRYGELAKVELPTGGGYRYEWGAGVRGGAASGVLDPDSSSAEIYRRVAARHTYTTWASGPVSTMTVSRPDYYQGGGVYGDDGYVTVEHFIPGGARQSASRHYYHGNALQSLRSGLDPIGYSPWKTGKEYQTEALALDGQTPLRRVVQEWRQRAAVSWWTLSQDIAPANDPRVVETVATLLDTNQVSKTSAITPDNSVGFDQYNNPTDVWEYEFGSGAPGALVRHTHTDYVTGGTYTDHTGAHVRRLAAGRQVYAVNSFIETLVAKSETLYDQYSLTAYGAVSGWADPGTAARGNATTQRAWLDTAGAWIETHASYDQLGNLRSATDAKGNVSTVSYADNFSDGVNRNTFVYPSQTTSPVPDPTNQRGTNTPLVSSIVYDYSTGRVLSTTDANGRTTSFQYNDPLDRLRRVDRPDGGWTQYNYGSNSCGDWVGTYSSINSTQSTEGYQFFDGLGRPSRSFQYHNNASDWLTADTQYDALGRVWRVSDTYQSGGCGSAVNPSGRWVESTYDPLGRVTHVKTTADGAQVVTSYAGNQVTATDQAGKSRRSTTDALGRLTQVVEDPNGLAHQTSYQYDALGNLRKVEQGSQSRYFMYDSLGRLVRARNPEQAVNAGLNTAADPVSGNSQWSLGYSYDANGNLSQRTDARGVTATYGYDNLNRNTTITYSNDPQGTPSSARFYDGATNGRGRLWWDRTAGAWEAQTGYGYDVMGRVRQQWQYFKKSDGTWSQQYMVSLAYDKMGNVTSQTYPSGRAVNYPQHDAAGRLKQVTGNLGGGATRTYADQITYDEAGRMREERFGTQTPLYHKLHYNVRGQLYDIRLSTSPWSADEWNWNRGAVVNYYGGAPWQQSGASNNGNVTMSQSWVPADDQISAHNYTQQSYAYDSLNRLSSVTEQAGTQAGISAAHGAQHYSYDRWGNRTINSSLSYGTGIPEPQFSVDTATNRLGVPAGQAGVMQYDNAGNLTHDTYTGAGSRAYDAEGRMISGAGTSLLSGTFLNRYGYDADGRRVRRKTESGEVWQVYGAGGELLAEYAANAAPSQPQKEYAYRSGEMLVVAEADFTWVNDALPAGAQTSTGGVNEAWNWVGANPSPVSGSLSDQMAVTAGLHQQYFQNATQTMSVGAGETLVAYVYLDPANPPSEIMLQWHGDTGGWEHRAYWGANLIGWGVDGTGSRRHMGPLPQAGQWVRLEVPAAAVGLEGKAVHGLAVTLHGGRATWDKLGKGGVRWVVSDHLGTTRMTVDQSGSLAGVRRHDYLPFGEEVGAGTGGRTTGQGYANDSVRQQFTGKERDNETTLDYFFARYYSPTQGRFTGADDPLVGVYMDDPQTWNAYAYTSNNPLNRVDPDGQRWAMQQVAGGYQYHWFDHENKDENGLTAYDKATGKGGGWSAVDWDESRPYHYTAGILEVGESVTDVTLNTDGSATQQQRVIGSGAVASQDAQVLGALAGGNALWRMFTGIISLFDGAGSSASGQPPPATTPQRTVQIVDSGGDAVHIVANGPRGQVEVMANMSRQGDTIVLQRTHIDSPGGAGSHGIRELKELAREFGRQQGASRVIIEGGKRQTGLKEGTVPRPIVVNVK